MEIFIDGNSTRVDDVYKLANNGKYFCDISYNTRKAIEKSRQQLEDIVKKEPIYGVTTGYGEMVYRFIDKKD